MLFNNLSGKGSGERREVTGQSSGEPSLSRGGKGRKQRGRCRRRWAEDRRGASVRWEEKPGERIATKTRERELQWGALGRGGRPREDACTGSRPPDPAAWGCCSQAATSPEDGGWTEDEGRVSERFSSEGKSGKGDAVLCGAVGRGVFPLLKTDTGACV